MRFYFRYSVFFITTCRASEQAVEEKALSAMMDYLDVYLTLVEEDAQVEAMRVEEVAALNQAGQAGYSKYR